MLAAGCRCLLSVTDALMGTSGITVVIRGIAMPPFPLRSMRIVQDAVARAMSAFDDKFSAYCFRWPLAMSPDKVLVRCEGSPVSMRRPLQELVAQSDTGACRLGLFWSDGRNIIEVRESLFLRSHTHGNP